MKRISNRGIFFLMILLAVGFSVVTVRTIINGGAIIGVSDDFEVIFSKANTDNYESSVMNDGSTITFSTKNLTEVGDKVSLYYYVLNNSKSYDANVSVSCDVQSTVDGVDYSNYFTIEYDGFKPSETVFIASQESHPGIITITLKKAITDSVSIPFTVTLDASAGERETFGTYHNRTAAEFITSLAESGLSQLATDDPDGNVRYIGANPNNYIQFGGVNWRIIGVFDGRLKIIREEPIGYYSIDSSESSVNNGWGVNEWSQADLMAELNTDFLNKDYSLISDWYDGSDNQKESTFYHSYGLSPAELDYVDDVTWYLGSPNVYDGVVNGNTSGAFNSAEHAYNTERGTTTGLVCPNGDSMCDTVERTTTWYGKVGLMYPSDVMYSSSGYSEYNMTRNDCLNQWAYACSYNSWLTDGTTQWTMTPIAYTNMGYAFGSYYASWSIDGAYRDNAVRPVVYLNPLTSIADSYYGYGTQNYPYVLNYADKDYQFCDMENETCDFDTIGSGISIGDEQFFVIGKQDETHVNLLARYGLSVGNGFTGDIVKQDKSAKGLKAGTTTAIGGNVYDSEAAFQQYDEYMSALGVNTTSRTISNSELESLGCQQYTCQNAPLWVRNMSYYVGEKSCYERYGYEYCSYNYFIEGTYYGTSSNYWGMQNPAIRPVITIEI